MPKLPTPIALTAKERKTLRAWQRAGTTEQRLVERARIVPDAAHPALDPADGAAPDEARCGYQVEADGRF